MNRLIVALTIASISGISAVVVGQQAEPEGTFSIVARDPNSGELGMAVQSKALATGSRTITIKGGVGVVAHQSQSNPMYGTLGLELLTTGMSPQQALDLNLGQNSGKLHLVLRNPEDSVSSDTQAVTLRRLQGLKDRPTVPEVGAPRKSDTPAAAVEAPAAPKLGTIRTVRGSFESKVTVILPAATETAPAVVGPEIEP